MVDRLSPEHRSWNMSRILGKDTSPERLLRSMLHKAGYRFRLHTAKLPGRPDIVLKKYATVIFVNGCYWHRHPRCKKATTPSTRTEFWQSKFQETVARDARKTTELVAHGWRVITVWECELEASPQAALDQITARILGDADGS
jgi:DNA mismatch endonuclease (patch repair protein)